jgi:hypothetical protein
MDSINRFLEHPDEQTKQHIVSLFGTPEVLDIALSKENRLTELRLLYQRKLKECAKFVRYFEMRNEHNRTIYYLFFATNHPLGHVKMKEAFWKVDSSSGFRFSDATNPNQLVLFEVGETDRLAQEIHDHFEHQKVLVEEIKRYVEDQTPFLAKHMRKVLKLLEDDKKITVSSYKKGGKKRRKGTFPEDVMIEFVLTLF